MRLSFSTVTAGFLARAVAALGQDAIALDELAGLLGAVEGFAGEAQ